MNIAKILKDAPKGTKLYSTVYGDVELLEVNNKLPHAIRVKICNDAFDSFSKEGKFSNNYPNGECVLFPSKENRDWSKFKVEKSCEFKPFDKVLVRANKADNWICDYFSHMNGKEYICSGNVIWDYCIPYNDDTKHLVGTNEEFNY